MLRRRARLDIMGIESAPITMRPREISAELGKRKIIHDKTSIAKMVEALEVAFEKETEARVYGDGYEFGRRTVSASNIIDSNEMSDAEVRKELKKRGKCQIMYYCTVLWTW